MKNAIKITCTTKGNFKKTLKKLDSLSDIDSLSMANLRACGDRGVEALKENTPKDTGKTANSWTYDIIKRKDRISIDWYNTNVNDGVNIAVIIQYGHATKDGKMIRGIDYINPSIKPIFEEIAKEIEREVNG